tara:strand:+ start:1229 stop:1495 length:267 start_codon:yes stop_codon:yes gene_type:complete
MSNNTINDGGSAFPHEIDRKTDNPHVLAYVNMHRGITVRDYFAGQALAGMCANAQGFQSIYQADLDADAGTAYDIADAMIAARNQSRQ